MNLITQQTIKATNEGPVKAQRSFQKAKPGLDTGDDVMNQVALVMRLLHIEELRELQTQANKECSLF